MALQLSNILGRTGPFEASARNPCSRVRVHKADRKRVLAPATIEALRGRFDHRGALRITSSSSPACAGSRAGRSRHITDGANEFLPVMEAIGFDRETMQSLGFRGGTPYSLRHSFASLLLACGRQPGYVPSQLGHSTAILWEHYEHLSRNSART